MVRLARCEPCEGGGERTLDDDGSTLVSENHRVLDDKVADTAMFEVVYVAAADSGSFRSDDGAVVPQNARGGGRKEKTKCRQCMPRVNGRAAGDARTRSERNMQL
jgi:hypothetical protein